MPARRPSGRGVPEHLRNLERQTRNSGQAANCRAFCRSETDFRPAIRCLPESLRFPLVLPDRNTYRLNVSVAHVWAEQERVLDKAGQRMPVEDSYIAATARRHGLTHRHRQ